MSKCIELDGCCATHSPCFEVADENRPQPCEGWPCPRENLDMAEDCEHCFTTVEGLFEVCLDCGEGWLMIDECLDIKGRPLSPGRWCATHECWDCGNELLGEEWEAEGGWYPRDNPKRQEE